MTDYREKVRSLVYVRVSSKEQAEGFSLATQERLCRGYSAEKGYEVDRVFVEAGVSAKTTDRPELQAMLR